MDEKLALILRIAAITIMPCAVMEMVHGNEYAGLLGWFIAVVLLFVADMPWKA